MRWSIPDIPDAEARRLALECGLEPPAARVLYSRGLRTAPEVERFLRPKLSDLHDPFLLKGMDAAVERLHAAIASGERILIYGDYDVDGTSSIVMLARMIGIAGGIVSYHVPDRLRDGYGIQTGVLDRARREGVSLVVSVDTGIRAAAAIEYARSIGLDTIVTDHHLPDDTLPPATAILNPNQPGCPYPNKNLCGAGVTFKLIQALMGRLGWAQDRIARFSDSYLILAAVATVADVVPLTGENRIIVQRGLEGLLHSANHGIRALLEVCGLETATSISASDIGFRIAPRLNAAGRMDNAGAVIELFLTTDPARARAIAFRLDALNSERQRTCDSIASSILDRYTAAPPPPDQAGLVFYDPSWHRGVVGIVASRVTEAFHRPALVLGRDEATGYAQGSGRSISAFHLLDALESMSELFIRFGGHKQAVGLTLDPANVGELSRRFNEYAVRALGEEGLTPTRALDAELRLDELSEKAASEILSLAPFGLGNRTPVFLVSETMLRTPPEPFGKDRTHLRLLFAQNGEPAIQSKAWRFSDRLGELSLHSPLDLALSVEADSYSAARGGPAWSTTVRDVRASGSF